MTYTIESAAAALAAGETTIESIAAETRWPIIEDCLVPDPNMWHADDGNAEIIEDHDSGRDAAQAYVDRGEWGDNDETSWVTVHVWLEGIDTDGDTVRVSEDSHKIAIEPDEPKCIGDEEHDWHSPYEIVGGCKENPGVWGSGGGVCIQEVCTICGCGKITDTWAHDPSDGEQGLTSVSYQPGKYTAEVERMYPRCRDCGTRGTEDNPVGECATCGEHQCQNCGLIADDEHDEQECSTCTEAE